MLCWRGYEDFARALESYEAAGLFDLFGETMVFFQDADTEAAALAGRFGLDWRGSTENLGILGGFKALASAMDSELLLLLENDLPLIEDREETARQIELATRLLLSGQAQVVRLRSVRQPGQKFDTTAKYARYHGGGMLPLLRRSLRPGKAKRLAGSAVYVREQADRHHRGLIDRSDEGTYLVSAAALPWTNQSIMLRRDFFLERILAHAEAHPSRRRVNGHPDIEKEWNGSVWRRSGWKIGVPSGLFTHERTDRP